MRRMGQKTGMSKIEKNVQNNETTTAFVVEYLQIRGKKGGGGGSQRTKRIQQNIIRDLRKVIPKLEFWQPSDKRLKFVVRLCGQSRTLLHVIFSHLHLYRGV